MVLADASDPQSTTDHQRSNGAMVIAYSATHLGNTKRHQGRAPRSTPDDKYHHLYNEKQERVYFKQHLGRAMSLQIAHDSQLHDPSEHAAQGSPHYNMVSHIAGQRSLTESRLAGRGLGHGAPTSTRRRPATRWRRSRNADILI